MTGLWAQIGPQQIGVTGEMHERGEQRRWIRFGQCIAQRGVVDVQSKVLRHCVSLCQFAMAMAGELDEVAPSASSGA